MVAGAAAMIGAETHNKARKLFDEFGAIICKSCDTDAILLALGEVAALTLSTIACPACRHDAVDAFGRNLVAQRDRIDHSATAHTDGKLCHQHLEKLQ
jgi:hypothetical protein